MSWVELSERKPMDGQPIWVGSITHRENWWLAWWTHKEGFVLAQPDPDFFAEDMTHWHLLKTIKPIPRRRKAQAR